MDQPTPRILIVEDDQRLAELTAEYLQANGFEVAVEGDGGRAVRRIVDSQPDLVILDLMLPGEDGLSICRRVRGQYAGPILMLTARSDELDQVQGLDLGADDYVCKPVRPRVLLARIQALLRRSEAPESKRLDLAFGPLRIDNRLREAWLGEQLIDLTGAEFDLLGSFLSHPQRVIARERLIELSRTRMGDSSDRSIDVLVSRLRRKLSTDDRTAPITTVRGVGYMFNAEVSRA